MLSTGGAALSSTVAKMKPLSPLANRDSEGASGGRISLKFRRELPIVREFHYLTQLVGRKGIVFKI